LIVPLDPGCLLAAASDQLDAILLAPGARSAILRGAADVPQRMSFVGFECRLGADARVDFGTGIAAYDGCREILAREPDGAGESHDRWRSLRRVCREWSASPLLSHRVPAVFTEIDCEPDEAVREPSLFARLDWPRRTSWCDEIAEARLAALAFLRACYGPDGGPARHDVLEHCIGALPPNGWLHGVAAMLGRGERNPRLGLWVPRWRLHEYTARLGFPELGDALLEITCDFPDARGPFVELALDLAEAVSPRVGIEFTVERDAAATRSLLARLVARGLCSEAKAEAVRRWGGSETVALRGVDWPCTLVRQVSHLKLVLEAEGELQAKVYLTVTPVFRLCR
jgi:hypothetical protein